MSFLVDANLSPRVAVRLGKDGHEASHVRDHGLLRATDQVIAQFAVDNGSTIISADSDFATMLAFNGHLAPSLVLLRSVDKLTPDQQADLPLDNLPQVLDELARGAVVSLVRGHLRVRRLPPRRRSD